MNAPTPKAGRVEEISSPSNPRIKSIKALAMKKNREREGVFLAEGQKLVTDALQQGWTIRTLLHSRRDAREHGKGDQIADLAAKVRALGGDILVTNDKLLTSITRKDNPQTVVAVIEQAVSPLTSVVARQDECWVALDRVRDPGNLGTIVRTVDALGVKGVVLVGDSTDPFALEAVRATMGSLFHVALVKATEAEFIEFTNQWRADGGIVTGTHLKGAVDHRSIDYSTKPQLIVMGNEQQGMTNELVNACDNVVLISMSGAADSLNLAVATGIILFEARRHSLAEIGA